MGIYEGNASFTEKMLQEADQIKGLMSGTVTIGTFTSIFHWLPDILNRFQQKYPLIEIRLLDGHYHDIERWIADGTADFGFVNMPCSHGLETTMLIRDQMMCILPAGHEYSMKSAISLQDIVDEPFIMPAKGCDTVVRAWFDGQRAVPHVRFEIEDDHAHYGDRAKRTRRQHPAGDDPCLGSFRSGRPSAIPGSFEVDCFSRSFL